MQTLLLKLILLKSEALRFNQVPQNLFWWLQNANSQKRLRTTELTLQINVSLHSTAYFIYNLDNGQCECPVWQRCLVVSVYQAQTGI